MKTKTLTISITARKYNAVNETAAFEAVVKIGRMINANCIALEASQRVIKGFGGQPVHRREIKPIIVMLHKLGYKGSEIIRDLYPLYKKRSSFQEFLLMSDESQDKLGEAPKERAFVDLRIVSSNGRVASAIRQRDLIGKHLLTRKANGDIGLCKAEIDARAAYEYYKAIAEDEGSSDILNHALSTSYRWMLQFNYAGLAFIRGQCKELGLTLLEEEESKTTETVGVL